jgi:hypothetical protein
MSYQAYGSRQLALSAKWATARALGCQERELVVVRCPEGFRIRRRAGLERWIAAQNGQAIPYRGKTVR